MSDKFTTLSELEKKAAQSGNPEVVPDEEYDSDTSDAPVVTAKKITQSASKRAPRKILKKAPEGFTDKKKKLLNVVRDVLLCLLAFCIVANPWTVNKLCKISKFASKCTIQSDDIEGKIVSCVLNLKGFMAQVIGFIILTVIFKLLLFL